jgi:hypothetical protein
VQIAYAAVDCTKQQSLCQEADVTGYPTFIYYNYGKNPQKYTGGREVRLNMNQRLRSTKIVEKAVARNYHMCVL